MRIKLFSLLQFYFITIACLEEGRNADSCIVSLSKRNDNLHIELYVEANNTYCTTRKYENFSLLSQTDLIQTINFEYSMCYIFIWDIQNQLSLEHFLQSSRERRHYHSIKPISRPWSTALCHNELYVDTLTKIPDYFPYNEVIIFTEDGLCYNFITDQISGIIKEKYHVTKYKLVLSELNFLENLKSKLYLYDKVFFFLCSDHLMEFILEHAELRQLSFPNNVWVINNGAFTKKYALPYYTVLVNHSVYEGFTPLTNETVNLSNEDCISSGTVKSSDDFIKVTLWHGSHLKDLFESRLLNGEITQIIYENDFQLQKTNTKLKPLKLLSISDGPFLAEADYLFNDASKICESLALRCKKFDEKLNKWKFSCCYGYIAELYMALGKQLQFDVDLYLMKDMKYGTFDPETNSWNGMIGAIYRREYDMAGLLTINTERMKDVDFSGPVVRAEMGIATKKTDIKYPLFNLRVIGHLQILGIIAALGFFFVTILMIYFYDNTVLAQKIKVDLLKRKRIILQKYTLEESFSYVSGIMFQRDIGGKNPSTFAGRGVAIFCAFAMVALITLYTASLTVDQVTKVTNTQFKGLDDPKILNPTAQFPFGTIKDTSIEDFFRRSKNPKFQNIYQFMKQYNQDSLSEAVDKLLTGELGAFMDDRPFLIKEIAKGAECLIEIHPNEVATVSYGLALPANSSWTLPICEAIVRLKDIGYLEKLEKKWLYIACPTLEQGEFQTFDLTFFGTPTAILIASALISMILMIFECAYKRFGNPSKCTYQFKSENVKTHQEK